MGIPVISAQIREGSNPSTISDEILDDQEFGKKGREIRYPIFEKLFDIFQPIYAAPYYQELEHQKSLSWDDQKNIDSWGDLTLLLGQYAKDLAETLEANHELVAKFYKKQISSSGRSLLRDVKAVISIGTSRCADVLKIICTHLMNQGRLDLPNFRASIKIGMDFANNIASLLGNDDGIAIHSPATLNEPGDFQEAPSDVPLNSTVLTESKLEFTGAAKVRFSAFKENMTGKKRSGNEKHYSCAYKFFKLPLDINGDGEQTLLNGVQALYWLYAKKVEAALFGKTN